MGRERKGVTGQSGNEKSREEQREEGENSPFHNESGIPGYLLGNCGVEPRQNVNTICLIFRKSSSLS